ncbi:MAG: cadherin-like beta sandwich domain-containing protein, partial [Johnsonella sp.]|nr:cadherin-like beta sandwich domain-containing protein [Johnsonella sp.]
SSSQAPSASQNASVSQTPPGSDAAAGAASLASAETSAPAETSLAAEETTEAVRSGLTPLSFGGGSVSLEAPGETQAQTKAENEGPAAAMSMIPKNSSDSSTGPGVAGSSSGSPTANNDPAPTDYQPIAGDKTYVDVLLEAAVASGVSPYVLASMIIQEQGLQGSSGLISGNTEPYQGIYNFYNIEAYQSGNMSPTQRGLWWASQSGSYNRPWNSKDKAIIGGAIFYGNNYVKSGQDTFYLKKFNVQGDNLYKHQYMTYVEGAALEGARLSKAYSTELKDSGLVFTIPVFKNMPEHTVSLPEGDGSPNNKLKSLAVEGYALTPTFSMDTESYDLIVPSGISSVRVNAAAADANASVSGTGDISLDSGGATVSIEVKAQNSAVKKYTIQIRREGGAQGGNPSANHAESSEAGDTDIRLSPPTAGTSAPASSESTAQNAAVGLTPGNRQSAGAKKRS